MPSFNCRHPTCPAILPSYGFCPAHQQQAGDAARHYDQHQRDQVSRRFYNSKVWRAARGAKLATDPVCEVCRHELATIVHHRQEVKDIRGSSPELLTAADNLQSICIRCHNKHHKRRGPR